MSQMIDNLTREKVKLSKNLKYLISLINLNKNNLELAYCDEDHLSRNLIRYDPIFKPSWNKDIFWSDPFF